MFRRAGNNRVYASNLYKSSKSAIASSKSLEEKLKESEEKYHSLLEQSTEMLCLHDMRGNFLEVNTAAAEQTGYSKEELFRMNVFDLHPDKSGREDIIKQWESWPVGRSMTLEREHVCKNGTIITVELTASKISIGDKQHILALVRDITERIQQKEKIRYLSFHDSLTGLYNRHFLEEEMQRLNTERQLPISIIIADLNGLKLVNDTYGPDSGDRMLVQAADILRSSCWKEDIIARWGGDEFVIFLPQTPREEADIICKEIHKKCHSAYVEDVPISMALGTAVKNNMEKGMTEVLREAEDEMYKQKLAESRSIRSTVLNALLKTLEAKSYETEAHARRMQKVALKIGRKLELPDFELSRLNLLITLHDIGKINISEEILTKKGSLNEEEWEIIKKHPETGHRIAQATEEFAHVAEEILAHHERWDGMGYPQGLKGEEIPLLARITAIVDAYDIMSNGRPYKKALSLGQIITEFKRCAGTQFDPELVELFLSILEEEQCSRR